MNRGKTTLPLSMLLAGILVFCMSHTVFAANPGPSGPSKNQAVKQTTQCSVDVGILGGSKVGGALVVVTGPGGTFQARTDDRGAAVFSLPSGTYRAEASFPGYSAPAAVTFAVPDRRAVAVWFESVPFLVKVVDASGKPVAGADVTGAWSDRYANNGKTDGDGIAKILVPKGALVQRVSVHISNMGFIDKYAAVDRGTAQSGRLQITLEAGKKITVIFPKGGELFQPGSVQTVRWTYTGNIGQEVAVEFIPEGETRTVKVIPGGSGSCEWKLPAQVVYNGDWQIKVRSRTDPAVIGYSQLFRVKANTTVEELFGPKITITSPRAGDAWTSGAAQTISWTYKGEPPGPDVKLFLVSKGSPVETITLKTPIGKGGSGSFMWKTPSLPIGNYTIWAKGTQDERYRGESGSFSVKQPPAGISIQSPRAGENWKEGSTQTIRWTYTGSIGPEVNIGLFYRGSAVAVIAQGVKVMPGGSVSYQWVVPEVPIHGGDYAVRVIAFPPSGTLQVNSPGFTISGKTQPTGQRK